MGLFNRKKKKNQAAPDTGTPSHLQTIGVDGVFMIDVPKDWRFVESDRFRMKSTDEKVHLSITNYGKQVGPNEVYGIEDLKSQAKRLFDDFVENGGFIPKGELEIGKDFVSQSFDVDGECQYYYLTWRKAIGQMIISNFILREAGGYEAKTKQLLMDIGASIKVRVA